MQVLRIATFVAISSIGLAGQSFSDPSLMILNDVDGGSPQSVELTQGGEPLQEVEVRPLVEGGDATNVNVEASDAPLVVATDVGGLQYALGAYLGSLFFDAAPDVDEIQSGEGATDLVNRYASEASTITSEVYQSALDSLGSIALDVSQYGSNAFEVSVNEVYMALEAGVFAAFAALNDGIGGAHGAIEDSFSSVNNALTASADGVYEAISLLSAVPNQLLNTVVADLNGEQFEEISHLINQSGFAISAVKVGLTLFPHAEVHFSHVRDLSPEELQAFESQIENFLEHHKSTVGYIEVALLRGLESAGRYAASSDLAGVRVHLFPLPGITAIFDPFDYEEEHANSIIEAVEQSASALELERELEMRLMNIERHLGFVDGNGASNVNEEDEIRVDEERE